jgi:hypothetical protein
VVRIPPIGHLCGLTRSDHVESTLDAHPGELGPTVQLGVLPPKASTTVSEGRAAHLRRYRRRPGNDVVAVQLTLDTPGFEYRKWGHTQKCKPGDWIVDNGGDVHTVDRESFARTYTRVGKGRYRKRGYVWARRAESAGRVDTLEGTTTYRAGDYVVYNDPSGNDGYAMAPDQFLDLYEPDSDEAD